MASIEADERSPLLATQISTTSDYGQGSEHVTVSPISPQDLPPSSISSQNGVPVITCQVCTAAIELTGKQDQYVVKCNNCGEATPIKTPPPGKKYVRCPCNCLLICKTTSQKISCPRPNCKKIIQLSHSPSASAVTNIPGMSNVACGYCENIFLFNTLNNALARCPHCRKLSSVGRDFPRTRGLIFAILSLVWLAVAIGVTIGADPPHSSHWWGVWVAGIVVLYILFVASVARAIYYFTIRGSTILSFT